MTSLYAGVSENCVQRAEGPRPYVPTFYNGQSGPYPGPGPGLGPALQASGTGWPGPGIVQHTSCLSSRALCDDSKPGPGQGIRAAMLERWPH